MNSSPDRVCLELDVGYHTAVGHVREHNEDSLKVDRELALFAVADGMGGHNAGERASQIAVERLHAVVRDDDGSGMNGDLLRRAFCDANTSIFDESLAYTERRGMGTTMTALLLSGDTFWIAHVGDSRAWLGRDGQVSQITDDHSVMGEQLRLGMITAEEAEHHPMRNVLTRSLGNTPEVEVDVLTGRIRAGDTWILGTDGMTRVLDSARIGERLERAHDAVEAARMMVSCACAEDGTDNVTVVVVRCSDS